MEPIPQRMLILVVLTFEERSAQKTSYMALSMAIDIF